MLTIDCQYQFNSDVNALTFMPRAIEFTVMNFYVGHHSQQVPPFPYDGVNVGNSNKGITNLPYPSDMLQGIHSPRPFPFPLPYPYPLTYDVQWGLYQRPLARNLQRIFPLG